MNFKNTRPIFIVALALAQPLAFTPLARAADGSQTASTGAMSIAVSPLVSVEGHPLGASAFFALGTALVVVGIGTAVGDVVSVIVQNTVDGSKAVIHASTSIVKQLGISTGTAIQAVAGSTGHALVASGKILAFVPNELGKELLYQSRLSR
jgi:hypothetical protein